MAAAVPSRLRRAPSSNDRHGSASLSHALSHSRGASVQGTGFPISERDRLGLRGLVPPRQFTIEEQAKRILYRYHLFDSNLAKHSYLNSLHDRNETLFFHVLMNNIKEMGTEPQKPHKPYRCRAWIARQ